MINIRWILVVYEKLATETLIAINIESAASRPLIN